MSSRTGALDDGEMAAEMNKMVSRLMELLPGLDRERGADPEP
jgi:hypothetical protein